MNIPIPQLEFSPWYRWSLRNTIVGAENPGVYVLAITSEDLEEKGVHYADVHYIGMSNSKKGLKGRWGQYAQAIKGVKRLHSGGDTTFKDRGPYEEWSDDLFVAACPIECDVAYSAPGDLRNMGIVAYLEYEAFAQFAECNPDLRRPRYNKK